MQFGRVALEGLFHLDLGTPDTTGQHDLEALQDVTLGLGHRLTTQAAPLQEKLVGGVLHGEWSTRSGAESIDRERALQARGVSV